MINSSISKLQLTGQAQSHLQCFAPNRLLHKQVIKPFTALQLAAQKEGFTLHIASAFRSFERQLQIWNNKYAGITPVLNEQEEVVELGSIPPKQKLYHILHWSALPSTSRHHWGTDIDVYDPTLLPEQQTLQLQVNEYNSTGYFYELTQWLTENMAQFDFYRPYQGIKNGVANEPWHISYFPLADQFLTQLDLDLISDTLIQQSIHGKSLILEELPTIYKQYVCNISAR